MSTLELPLPPKGFEGVSEQLTDLPKVTVGAYQRMSPRTSEALNIIAECGAPMAISCKGCGHTREMLIDRSVATSARHLTPEPRYEPCSQCYPFAWYQARMENLGVPPMEPICDIEKNEEGEVISRRLRESTLVVRQQQIYFTGNRRRVLHALIMSSANGWYLSQKVLEDCVRLGANALLEQAIGLPYALAIEVGPMDFGEHLPAIMQREGRTWIIDPTQPAESLIPETFYRIKA